jgi:TonB family protein
MIGTGVFLVHIRADGAVRLVETVQSTGHPELDNSTIAAFQKWRFRVDRPTQVKIPITYSMGGGARPGTPILAISR